MWEANEAVGSLRSCKRRQKKNSVDILAVECTGYRKSGSIRTWDSLKEDLDVPKAAGTEEEKEFRGHSRRRMHGLP